jgi:hypothetical protein
VINFIIDLYISSMDFLRDAASKAVQSARKSAKHALEIAGMGNTAARTIQDHDSASQALGDATGAIDEMHTANNMHMIAKNALDNGDHEQAVQATVASLEASQNAARLSHNAAINAGNAGAPPKVVNLVTDHALKAYADAAVDHANLINTISP